MPLRLDVTGESSGSPSTRLYTRRSLRLTRKLSRSENPDESNSLDEISGRESVTISTPRVPMELLEHTLDFYVEAALAYTAHNLYPNTPRAAFRAFIQCCTLVSQDFRFLVLRRFFQSLAFTTTKESQFLFAYLAAIDLHYLKKRPTTVYSWVRSLKSPAFLLPVSLKGLLALTRLERISIDFTHSGLTLQCTCVAKAFETICLPNIIRSLTSITLTKLPRIDIHLLTLISEYFPALTSVHVSSTDSVDTCCPSCYENSLGQVVHSPIPDLYADIDTLAVCFLFCLGIQERADTYKNAFGTSLASLKRLTHLFIGIFLSRSDLPYEHIDHSADDSNITQISLGTIFRCLHCKDYRNSTKRNELKASLLLSQHLESLEYIGWSSCFGMSTTKGQTEEDVLEGVLKFTDARDMVFSSPPAKSEADKDTLQTLSTHIRHDLTTAFSIRRLTNGIKVSRFL